MEKRPPEANHESYARLERACRRPLQLDRDPLPSEIAKLINESQQTVNNWKRRGVAVPGALAAESVSGAYACWILTGEGPAVDLGAELRPWPFPRVDPARWDVCDDDERNFVQGAINEALRNCEAAREKRRAPALLAAALASQAARTARANFVEDPGDGRAPGAEDLSRDAPRGNGDNVLAE